MDTVLMTYKIAAVVLGMILIGLLIYSRGKNIPHRVLLVHTIAFSFLALASYFVFMVAGNEQLAFYCGTIFVGCAQASACGVALFVMYASGAERKLFWYRPVLGAIVLLNVAALVVNLFNNWLFTIEGVIIGGTHFWDFVHTKLYFIENIFNLLISVMTIVPLVIKIIRVPSGYKELYILFLVSFLLVVGGSAISEAYNFPLDFSVMFYAGVSGAACYHVSNDISKRLISRMLRRANRDIGDGLICYTASGRAVYANDKARSLFMSERTNYIDAMVRYRENRVSVDNDENGSEIWEEAFLVDGQEHICDVRYRVVAHKGQVMGSYLQFLDKTEELRAYDQQYYQATHDLLTGIYNRSRFFEEVDKRMKENRPTHWIMLASNVKDFKMINVLYGEETGNAVLVKQAEFMRKYAHRSTLYGRISDDKYGMLMEKHLFNPEIFISGMKSMKAIAESQTYQMHIQIGIYDVEDTTEPASVMYDKAVLARMSIADDYEKIFADYDPSMLEQVLRDKQLVDFFSDALERGDVGVYLQRQVDAEGNILGGKAIPCVMNQGEHILGTLELVKAIERSSRGLELNHRIWEQSLRILRDWEDMGREWYVAFIVTAKDLFSTDVCAELSRLTEQFRVKPQHIHLEIAESTLMIQAANNIELLKRLQQKGFYVVISDFGSGYSSLNVLKDMNPDAIMIGEVFYERDDRSDAILKAIVEMADSLGISLVLRGIDTADQYEHLKKYRTGVYQGNYFAKPVRPEEFAQNNLQDSLQNE